MSWSTAAAVVGVSLYVLDLIIKVVALGVIPGNRRPTSGMAWLLLIVTVPFLGFAMFLLIGRTRIERRRHEEQRQVNETLALRTAELPTMAGDSDVPAYLPTVAHLNRALGALPVVAGNAVALQPGYRESIAAMARDVDAAEDHVDVEFYITAWDEVTAPLFDALIRATERGVRVRLLFDHLGSRGIPGYDEMLTRLQGTAIQWRPMLPFKPLRGLVRRPDLRNHRKILVVDGVVAHTGSQNLIEPGYNKPANHRVGREWVELMARVEGPLVQALAVVFATDWYSESGERLAEEVSLRPPASGPVFGQVIPSGPGFDTENNLRAFTALIYSASRRVSICSPYFVPDESLLYAVTTAAQRGVGVDLFVSEVGDQFVVHHAQRSYYEMLLRSGVRIFLYPAPAVLHAKHFTVDDDVAVLGSSNMDMRSFALNYEVSVMLFGGEVVAEMHKVEDTYRAESRELTLEEWLGRPWRMIYVDNVMRLASALL